MFKISNTLNLIKVYTFILLLSTVNNILNPNNWISNYADELYGYALSKTGTIELAEDLVQETFLAALKSKNTFRGNSSERTWLFAILKNTIANHYRKASTRSEISNAKLMSDLKSSFTDYYTLEGDWQDQAFPNNWQISPSAALENKELADALDRCLKKLPPKQKQVILLKLVEEEDTESICKDLDLSDTNYWILIHRAKLQLRACIERSWMQIK